MGLAVTARVCVMVGVAVGVGAVEVAATEARAEVVAGWADVGMECRGMVVETEEARVAGLVRVVLVTAVAEETVARMGAALVAVQVEAVVPTWLVAMRGRIGC